MSQGGGEGSSGSGGPPILLVGAEGPWVEKMQRRLIGRGFDIVPDGIFGPITQAALDGFLESRGLSKRGMVDEDTWELLED